MPVLQISPEAATKLLEGNTRNRKINKNAIKRYSALMSEGLWKAGNDAICVAPDGTLLNGQHRLSAVIDSGVSVEMLVRTDVDPEEIKAMDQGTKRIGADIVTLTGHQMSRRRAMQLRYLGTPWEQGCTISTPGPDALIALDLKFGGAIAIGNELVPKAQTAALPGAVNAAALLSCEPSEDLGPNRDVANKIADFWSIFFNNQPAADRLLDTKEDDFIACQGYMQHQEMLRENKRLKTFQQYKVYCVMLDGYIRGEVLTRKNRLSYRDALAMVPSIPVFTY